MELSGDHFPAERESRYTAFLAQWWSLLVLRYIIIHWIKKGHQSFHIQWGGHAGVYIYMSMNSSTGYIELRFGKVTERSNMSFGHLCRRNRSYWCNVQGSRFCDLSKVLGSAVHVSPLRWRQQVLFTPNIPQKNDHNKHWYHSLFKSWNISWEKEKFDFERSSFPAKEHLLCVPGGSHSLRAFSFHHFVSHFKIFGLPYTHIKSN